MVSIIRSVLLVAFAAFALAVPQPRLDSEALEHYENMHGFLSNRYPAADQGTVALSTRREYYSHLLSSHTNGETEAKVFSQTSPNGPVHVSYGARSRTAYVTTKIPHDSNLGRTWGLGVPSIADNGERRYRDLYAFWKVDKRGSPKLLRLDTWLAGGLTPQVMSWDAVRHLLRG
ncbi:hypothetical protein PSEUBRA_006162 [Kalmanozyma brasiliensis GHG001]|uniref:Uncharacterized protein n=1 Tax=Kalmanozyma brasiliensis (strain GHG001) TaxID=1365824 RepID=V5EJD8_KALBG|nr:uncharacterized protein PSEUBRA_006162 [Kalmanozyma brasiliensis GHG001]EST04845.1 hypothetical protein PSEUBRA_006162 [Kalmanozyma brasiliensis GHG001]